MSKTPIFDFVSTYAKEEALRLHMPGHKGKGPLGVEAFDITEIEGADVLYSADGIIKESERIASEIFGSAMTVYSAEGSSLSIRAMVYLVAILARQQGKRPIIAAGRNAHRAFLSAAALSDVETVSLYPENATTLVSCELTAEGIDRFLSECNVLPTAVYLTSPDYLGNITDVRGIAEVCHRRGVLLLVDNAHGAYLRFLPEDKHPISLGADLVCDSAHKTLPVLTGGAYLHVGKTAPALFSELAEEALTLFASTSPSYLILSSLDLANGYVTDGFGARLDEFVRLADAMKQRLCAHGFALVGDEPMKLSIASKEWGYYGTELAALLEKQGIVCEFSDPDFAVMMLSCELGRSTLTRIENALLSIEKRDRIDETMPRLPRPVRAMTVREAMFSPSVLVSAEEAEGKIFASAAIGCPPAISPITSGEVIDADTVRVLEYYGIDRVRAVKL